MCRAKRPILTGPGGSQLKQLFLYAVIAVIVTVSWWTMLKDKRVADVKMACEQALGGPQGSVRRVSPSQTTDTAVSTLVQVNEERRTCQLRGSEE